ncbi:TolC family protein [Burkholderia ubonensis]|uniref:TolC family protein n=1 Tax=Burkholderia ubonensis TaxID=101571 RepID=UPI00075F5CAF|nr:TolC family protein [Burkholderia ubonensis]KVC86474.1 hypothetical protein WI74_29980 [Burkholderia ubonensis]KWN90901.1 hypothetical protein WM25_28795 [Burkholderia ubonensis]
MIEMRLLVLLGRILFSAAVLEASMPAMSAEAHEALARSQASMPTRSVSLNGQTINLTLNDAVFLGLRNNRSIHSAYIQRTAQKFDLRVAEDIFTPKLVLNGSYIAERNQDGGYRGANAAPEVSMLGPYGTRLRLAWNSQLTQDNRSGRLRHDGASLTIIQPLLRSAGRDVTEAPVRLARLTEQANRLSLKSAVSDTVTQIISAYRELVRAQEQVRIARDALQRSNQLLEANKAMIDAGRMARVEIVQTEADIANQELAVEEANNQLDSSRLALLQLFALDLRTQVRAIDTPDANHIEVGLAQALTTAREHQPAYLAQLIAVEQAGINLTTARNSRLWDVSLIAGANQNRERYAGIGNRNWENYAGVQISIPIGDLSQRQAEVHARADIESQNIRLAEITQTMERDVGDAVRNLNTRWRQYDIARRACDLSRRKLEIEREKLQAGRSSNFQVLSFEADLRSAENARLNTLIAYLNTQTTLDRTLGTTLESWEIELND